MARIDSLQTGYTTGDLSLYPEALDSKESLYEVANNASTALRQSLTYSAKKIIVETTEKFPSKGILKITDGRSSGELVYYGSKNNNTFKDLVRGFAGSRQNQWTIGASVSNVVSAEHHNAVKDSIIKMEVNLGLKNNPSDTSLNGILKKQETKFLTPKPLFRAYPTSGASPLTVSFQNFSMGMAPNALNGPLIRCFWDFGDGNTSTEKNPVHTYTQEGSYSVELVVASILGGQGLVTKKNYIKVDNTLKENFFYVKNSPQRFPILNDVPNITTGRSYSVDGGNLIDSNNPTIFELVDQTDGSVQERYWNFNGNGKVIKNFYKILSVSDPDIFIESRFIKEINPDNDIAFVYIKDGNVITKIIKILSVSGSGDGKITLDGSIEDTGSIKYLGVILPETVSTYTEKDPNVHSIHFMYESAAANSKYNPSVFILFKNQYIKKTFLKEQIVID
jgi:PKD repeat protein